MFCFKLWHSRVEESKVHSTEKVRRSNMFELKTKAPKANNREVKVNIDLDNESLENLVSAVGAPSVVTAAIAQYRVDAQAVIRGMLEDGKTDEEITATMSTWKPGAKLPREPREKKAPTIDSVLSFFDGLSPEAKADFIAKMREKVAGAPQG